MAMRGSSKGNAGRVCLEAGAVDGRGSVLVSLVCGGRDMLLRAKGQGQSTALARGRLAVLRC
jgi:hypothetical protein